MVLLVCIDDRYGMLFNRRRQSSDRAVTEKILELTAGKKLWMNSYSRNLFPENAPISVDDDFLRKAGEGEFCFAENCDVKPFINFAEKIVLFRWNRCYPADLLFPKELLCRNWTAEQRSDFSGSSHDKITMEVYGR